MKLKNVFVLLLLLAGIWSCKNDDDDDDTTVELQTLSETALENDTEIQAFMQTHFYEVVGTEIIIDTISGDNATKSPISDIIQSFTVSLAPSDLGLEEDDDSDVEHTLYYFVAEDGDEDSAFATIADSTYLNYVGLTLDREVFDSATSAPVWFDLLNNSITGFSRGLTKFKQGGDVIENVDGTFEIDNPSLGFIIMPSGLGYFSSSTQVGESYAPLVFTVNVVRTLNSDHDNDGIPSILEDLDGNNNVFDDNTDEDFFPNYLDTDDDDDGTSTIDEITDDNGDIITPYPDTDGDGTPDYLDSDS